MSAGQPSPIYRTLTATDFTDALHLYKELVGTIPVPDGPEGVARFAEILRHPGTVIWGAEVDGRVISMATLHILPNMTFSARPYCLVENVVTLRAWHGRGLARGVMDAAMQSAWAKGAYKIMLLTGKSLGAKGFYEKLGFSDDQKYGMMIRRAPARQPVVE
jgi:GNAT superfamily N-acetyltransferase